MLPSDYVNDVDGHPLELNHAVRHRRQYYNWDCGLACVRMVLPVADARYFDSNFRSICQSEGFKNSTWTIDLCYLLHKFGVPHAFRTKTLGVHSGYQHAAFYAPVLAGDEARVIHRFREAHCIGLDVREAALSLDAILTRLRRGPAIVLTDSRMLTCSNCKRGKSSSSSAKGAYSGHYVVLTGFSIRQQMVYYRNPAYFDHQCGMPMSQFDDARKAFGTDEDIIFIENENENGNTQLAV